MSTRQARRRQQRVTQRRGGPKRTTTPWYLGPWGLGVAAVVIGVVVVAIIVAGRNSKTAGGQFASKPAPPSVLAAVTSPPQSTLAKVGTGGMPSHFFMRLRGHPSRLRSGGKPEILYVGAEYCPFCAAERWALINALSRFGKFSNIHLMKSTANDVYPDTNTFTFLHSTYSSKYITFIAKETQNRSGHPLQSLTSSENALVTKYDKPPYSSKVGGIPFIDLANRVVPVGLVDAAQLHVSPSQPYSPALSWSEITGQLGTPSNSVAQTVLGNGNWLTAGICRLTGNKPASTCSKPPIPKLEHKLKFHR